MTVPKIDHTGYLNNHSYSPLQLTEIVGKYEWSSGLGGAILFLNDDSTFSYRVWSDLYVPDAPAIWSIGNYYLSNDSLIFQFNGYKYVYSDSSKNRTEFFEDLNSVEKKEFTGCILKF